MELFSQAVQYTNSVLLAVLPHISQFAQRIEIPLSLPITTNDVHRFYVIPGKPPECGLVLTNGMQFHFFHGHVSFFAAPDSFKMTRSQLTVTNFYGPVTVTRDEAIRLARARINRLGYTLKETFIDQAPDVEMPLVVGTNTAPFYVVKWNNPWDAWAADERYSIEVELKNRTVTYMACTTRSLFRELPHLDLAPPTQEPILNPQFSEEALSEVLPLVSEFAHRLQLTINHPLTRDDIASFDYEGREKIIRLKLINGYFFYFQNGYVSAVYAPDCFYPFYAFPPEQPRGNIDDFVGEWNVSPEQATQLARGLIEKLGYRADQFGADRKPIITKTKAVGDYVVPRYLIEWRDIHPSGFDRARISVEIDAANNRIKSFYWFSNLLIRTNRTINAAPFLHVAKLKPTPKPLQAFRSDSHSLSATNGTGDSRNQ
jgi:hypothetical protein